MTTEGRLLDGRLVYHQPASGFRSGIEPVLLAAAVPAKPGDRILEAGTGAGATLLCLHARVPCIRSLGIEVDEAMARLAAANARANGFTGIEVNPGRIEAAAPHQAFDHALANPPYHPACGSASPDHARDVAKRASQTLVQAWIAALSGQLRDRGSLTLIVPSALLPTCVTAMAESRCPCTVIYPLWPRIGQSAKLVMIRGIRNSRTPMRLAPGLVLHQLDGTFSETAQSILRDGAALAID
ncbi:tRNA1(Val) (adenine(37)-N6)-methyltransferase [Rhodopila sp.]|uniref:tRNA1(Val) (adenine(37)-N6)-methyltransferase n=1 Tax=Rhodopila sp. TaxID=2480087 RepID=UPI003D0D5641